MPSQEIPTRPLKILPGPLLVVPNPILRLGGPDRHASKSLRWSKSNSG